MQERMTLKEYANFKNISSVTLGKWVSNKKVDSIKEGGRRFILVEKEDLVKPLIKDYPTIEDKHYLIFIKELQKEKKELRKEKKALLERVRELENKLNTEHENTKELYQQFIHEMKQLSLPSSPGQNKEKKKKSKNGGKAK